MQELEVSGKNIEEAITIGIKKLDCTKDEVEIKILDEGTSGLFGLMGAKPAKILLTLKKENNKNISEKKDVDIDSALACKNVESYVREIISMMNISLKTLETSYKDGIIEIEVSTDNGSLLIGKGGQSLDALEYIVQLMLNTNPKTRVKINLDTENYRLKQQERLKVIAEKAIEYVQRTKKIYRFDPMSAKERKFIHMYLKDIGGFDTFSEGEGTMRKVGVKLLSDKK
ncbi:MAG: RNA-binding cell elongation regulator Jag/EloR [Endomicrobiia bacterium]|jgi:spoIIIJ-associated protein|nr:Jag N-terminal domain-containing protein [Endomicrobiaceae bacterium]MDD3053046.1 Jag N-terminal domain-containing protein [Endomicrobiaceae bacterium]MDD3922182.1 Jag N-terminal domain-containing protein [Endomicrobiaceae bacterium]MDD5102649.1 Jag N-terminal domain-containing protein [Endomicrobiaceae bacterium]